MDSITPSVSDLLVLRAKLTAGRKHLARATFRTRRAERHAETEHHMWSAQGMERPTYRGRHAAEVSR